MFAADPGLWPGTTIDELASRRISFNSCNTFSNAARAASGYFSSASENVSTSRSKWMGRAPAGVMSEAEPSHNTFRDGSALPSAWMGVRRFSVPALRSVKLSSLYKCALSNRISGSSLISAIYSPKLKLELTTEYQTDEYIASRCLFET